MSLVCLDCLPVVAKWTVEATKSLEMTDRKFWPENGLSFATSVLQTMLSFGNQVRTLKSFTSHNKKYSNQALN